MIKNYPIAAESNGIAGAYSKQPASQPMATASAAAQSLTPEEKLLAAVEQEQADQPHPADQHTINLLKLFAGCQVLPEEEIEETSYLFQWGSVGMMERHNIVSLKAPAKAGKTFVLTAFASAFLKGDFYGLRSNATPDEIMLFVDTEQARNSTRKVLKRILKECPQAAQRCRMLNVRNVPAADRMPLIELAVSEIKPSLIVVDGIADLIPGMEYNDTGLADEAIARLGQMAEDYNAVVIAAIHTNKGDSSQASGWLGRILLQKCAVEMGLKRQQGSDTRTIEFVTRDREIDPIPFAIECTEDNLGRIRIISATEAAVAESERKRAEKRAQLAEMGIEPPLEMSKADLVTAIVGSTGKTRDAVRKIIDGCINVGVLTIGANKVVKFTDEL